MYITKKTTQEGLLQLFFHFKDSIYNALIWILDIGECNGLDETRFTIVRWTIPTATVR
jgi:hypothetical protein